MATVEIPLEMTREQLEILFTYPNIKGSDESLEDTILHWFGQTLERDGLKKEMATICDDDGHIVVCLDGPSEEENALYATRLPGLLRIGWWAWERVEKVVKPNGKWDPAKTGEWRFFLTLGVGIANFRTLQFFHYPPARLVDPLRDSMHDPVTFRCRDLLEANGIVHDANDNTKDRTRMYETRINSTPVAAPDDQGTPRPPYQNGAIPDPISGSYIPVEYFNDFQMKMIQLYLHPHPTVDGYTIPMIVYGRNPRKQLVGQWMDADSAAILQMLPAKPDSYKPKVDQNNYLKTPVLGSNHPYLFYAIAQIDDKRGWGVGGARLVPENVDKCVGIMQDDLAVTYWQTKMADDPSQDPWLVVKEGREYWKSPEQLLDVCALIWRQASLRYDQKNDPLGNHFTFDIKDWKTAREEIASSNLDPVEFLKSRSAKAAESPEPPPPSDSGASSAS